MLIVDNASYSYFNQLDNAIPIIPFYDSKCDKELKYLASYLMSLPKDKSLPAINRTKFRTYYYLSSKSEEECLNELFKVYDT